MTKTELVERTGGSEAIRQPPGVIRHDSEERGHSSPEHVHSGEFKRRPNIP